MNKVWKFVKISSSPYFLNALFRTRVAASVEHQKIIKLIHPSSVVDIGANRGQFALLCRGIYPEVEIFSFEPLPNAVKVFRELFEGDNRVHLFPYAIGKNSGTTEIHVSGRDDSSSLLPITHQADVFPGTEEMETQQVEVQPLSAFTEQLCLEPPALMKIDVQGYELEVLRGSGELLREFSYIYVECSFEELYSGQPLANEVIDYLHQAGFVLQGVYNLYYDPSGKAIQGDFLFGRK